MNDLFRSLFLVENVENLFKFFLESEKWKKQRDDIFVFVQIFLEHKLNLMFRSFAKIRRWEYCFVFVRDAIKFEIKFDLNQSCFQPASIFVENIWFVDFDFNVNSVMIVIVIDIRFHFHSCTIADNRGVALFYNKYFEKCSKCYIVTFFQRANHRNEIYQLKCLKRFLKTVR